MYSYDAGRRLTDRSAYRQAATVLEQALAAVARLPEDRESLERGVDVRMELRTVLNALGAGKRAFQRLVEAEALGRMLGDRDRLASIVAAMVHQLWLAGWTDEARRCGQIAVELAEALGKPTPKARAYYLLGMAEVFWGSTERREASLEGDRIPGAAH